MLTFRTATREDAQLLFDWRNDPTTYEQSFHRQPISWVNHCNWLERVLHDPLRHFFVLTVDGKSVGQLRFDVSGNTAEISISIGREFRGQGFGMAAVKEGSRQFFSEHMIIKRIIARIKSTNIHSIHLFTKAGYRTIAIESDVVRMEYRRSEEV